MRTDFHNDAMMKFIMLLVKRLQNKAETFDYDQAINVPLQSHF